MNSFQIILPDSQQNLVIESGALEVFANARQLGPHDKETGGLLLARVSEEEVRIVEATRAERRASISRVLFKPSLNRKRKIVKEAFQAGMHFVGEWHTHPEENPAPSSLDINSSPLKNPSIP